MREIGKCPKCGSMYLDYGTLVDRYHYVYYPFKCEDCGTEGEERYNTEFDDMVVYK